MVRLGMGAYIKTSLYGGNLYVIAILILLIQSHVLRVSDGVIKFVIC